MLSINGAFQNGVAQPSEAVAGREGQTVIITFLKDATTIPANDDSSGRDQLIQLIEQNIVDAGRLDQ